MTVVPIGGAQTRPANFLQLLTELFTIDFTPATLVEVCEHRLVHTSMGRPSHLCGTLLSVIYRAKMKYNTS